MCVPAVGSVLSPARAMDFALEVAIAILVIGGHMIAAISFRIRYGAAMKCEICNVFLNGRTNLIDIYEVEHTTRGLKSVKGRLSEMYSLMRF